jgi:hypothetical protein
MDTTIKTLMEFFDRSFENMNIMARNIEILNKIKADLRQLEADAELGRAVRKAFAKGGYIQLLSEKFDIDTENDLLEWAKEVE